MAKSSQRGLYRRRGSPHWWIRFADETGTIVRESTRTSVKRLAREILAKRKTQVAEGRFLKRRRTKKTTFHQLCERYWKLRGQHLRTKGLEGQVKCCKAGLGNPLLGEITSQRIERFLAALVEDRCLSPSTRNRYLALLSAMFNKAVSWELMESNPAQGIEKLREPTGRTRYLTADEIQALLDACSDDLRPIVLTALHTGMRRGEILALRWQEVDFGSRTITVRQSKSGKMRVIPMDETLRKTLFKLPSRFEGGLVFPSPKTGRQRQDLKNSFKAAKKAAKLKDLRFHDARHTFASHLVMAGVDIQTVQELLGHQSLAMTLRYSHLAPDHRTRAVRALDRAFSTDTKTDTVEKSATEGERLNR